MKSIIILSFLFLFTFTYLNSQKLDENSFKNKIIEIEKNEYKPEILGNLSTFILDNLDYLGHTNPQIRDDLFTTFLYKVIQKNIVNDSTLKLISNKLLSSDYLFYNIEKVDDSSVFKRTFSVLLFSSIIKRHNTNKFLTAIELKQIKEKIIQYINTEKNELGYDNYFGWAHSPAHTADALKSLLEINDLTKEDYVEIVNSAFYLITKTNNVYTHGEDKRIASAIFSAIHKNNLTYAETTEIINNNIALLENEKEMIVKFYKKQNMLNLVRSLYFYMNYYKKDAGFIEYLRDKVYKLM